MRKRKVNFSWETKTLIFTILFHYLSPPFNQLQSSYLFRQKIISRTIWQIILIKSNEISQTNCHSFKVPQQSVIRLQNEFVIWNEVNYIFRYTYMLYTYRERCNYFCPTQCVVKNWKTIIDRQSLHTHRKYV